MPIAPITGKLRKRLWLDLSSALGLGIAAGYAYWCALFALRCCQRSDTLPNNRYGYHLKASESGTDAPQLSLVHS